MRIKNLIKSTLPVLLCLFLYVIAYFAAFAITVLTGQVNVADASTATVNQGIFNIIRDMLIFIFCGYWYWRKIDGAQNFENIKSDIAQVIKHLVKPVNFLMLFLLGYGIQLGTDSILNLLGKLLENEFRSYNKMIASYKDSATTLLLITVIILGPIAEELVFRGLTLGYAIQAFENRKRCFIWANIFQAFLFGLYHANLIQFVYAFIFGMLLGGIAIKTRSLLPSMLLHMIINGSLFIMPSESLKTPSFAIIMIPVAITIISLATVYFKIKFTKPVEEDNK